MDSVRSWILNLDAIYFAFLTFFAHEVIWLFFNVQYLLIARYDWFRKYKLQPKVVPKFNEQWAMFKHGLIDHFTTLLPMLWCSASFQFVRDVFETDWNRLPALSTALWQFVIIRIAQGGLFYVIHLWLHTPWAYARFHKKHHEHKAPFALVGEYAHPVESTLNFFFPLLAGLLAAGAFAKIHLLTLYLNVLYSTMSSVESHCGYSLPWHMDYYWFLAFNGAAEHHDAHHQFTVGNYGAKWIDWIFGTDITSVRARQARNQTTDVLAAKSAQ
jgi:sterol desaturase/sphingolipid hydroxylase (fatty acid hydroxylase superfamily)